MRWSEDVWTAARKMRDEAKNQASYVSPPYASERERQAFRSGYEAALRDIAKRELDPIVAVDRNLR